MKQAMAADSAVAVTSDDLTSSCNVPQSTVSSYIFDVNLCEGNDKLQKLTSDLTRHELYCGSSVNIHSSWLSVRASSLPAHAALSAHFTTLPYFRKFGSDSITTYIPHTFFSLSYMIVATMVHISLRLLVMKDRHQGFLGNK